MLTHQIRLWFGWQLPWAQGCEDVSGNTGEGKEEGSWWPKPAVESWLSAKPPSSKLSRPCCWARRWDPCSLHVPVVPWAQTGGRWGCSEVAPCFSPRLILHWPAFVGALRHLVASLLFLHYFSCLCVSLFWLETLKSMPGKAVFMACCDWLAQPCEISSSIQKLVLLSSQPGEITQGINWLPLPLLPWGLTAHPSSLLVVFLVSPLHRLLLPTNWVWMSQWWWWDAWARERNRHSGHSGDSKRS